MIARFFVMCRCIWITCKYAFLIAWRARLGNASRDFVTECLRRASYGVISCTKTTIEPVNLDKLPIADGVPLIFMSNHLSLFDFPLIMSTIPKSIRMVIKKELTKVPFLGKGAIASEQVVVDRNNSNNRQQFYTIAVDKLKSGIALWCFPEGTRSKNGNLLPFKMGCFRLAQTMGATIIPVGLIGTNRILAAGKAMPKYHQHIAIRIGDPIDAASYHAEGDLPLLCQKTEQAIQELIKT